MDGDIGGDMDDNINDQWMMKWMKAKLNPTSHMKWLKNQLMELSLTKDVVGIQNFKLMMEEESIQKIYDRMMNQRTWGENYQLLLDFVKEHKRIPKPKDDDKKLSSWTHRVIQQLKHDHPLSSNVMVHSARRKNLLQIPEVQKHLNDPLVFPTERWEYKFNLLKEFIEKYHRLPSESRMSPKAEYKLAHWLVVQTQIIRGRTRWTTSEERRNLLMDIPLVRDRIVSMKKLRN
jgi:hypothetical protein